MMASTISSLVKNLLAFSQQVSSGEKQGDICRLISTIEESQILQAVDYTATRNSQQLIPLLKVIFAGLSNETPASRVTRNKLIQSMIGLLRHSRLEGHVPSGVNCMIFSEIDSLNVAEIEELLRFYKGVFERGVESNVSQKFIDVFPKLILTLTTLDNTDSTSIITGAEVRRQFLKEFTRHPNRQCADEDTVDNDCTESRWHRSSVVHVLSALKDAQLATEEKAMVVSKTIRLLPDQVLDETPNVVAQLLAFIADGPHSVALHGICGFFSECDHGKNREESSDPTSSADQWESLKRNQGLVILHLMYAIRQNQEICRQLLVVLKERNNDLLLPFNFGVLLALSQVSNRTKEQCLELGKYIILQYLKDYEKRANSLWVHAILRCELDLENLVKEVAENSDIGFGWQYSLTGLLELGFTLIETHLTKILFLSSGKLTVESPASAAYNACILGKTMIYKCFTALGGTQRQAVIDRLFRLITAVSPSGRGSAMFFIDVLSGIVCRGATTILAQEERLTDIFDLLPTMQSDIAVPMLKALLPIIKLSPKLRDALALALKKALFSRLTEARKTAVGGLLLFLKHFKIMNAFKSAQNSMYWHSFPTFGSQVLSDPKSDGQRSNYKRLCLEVIGCLRRVLSQQGEVKELLYHGLCSVIRRNVSTLQPVVDFLCRHLQNYVEKDESVMPPFKLKIFVDVIREDNVVITEAFGWLIYALSQSLKQAEDDKRRILEEDIVTGGDANSENQFYFDDKKMQQVRNALWNLAKRVSNAELEDFSLDKSADYSASCTGEANVKMGKVLLSTYEALIEFVWSFYDYEPDSAEMILCLHDCHWKLKCLLQERAQAKGKKATATGPAWKSPGNSDTATAETMALDLRCLYDMATQLLCDQSPNRRAGLAPLRGNEEFVRWLFQTILMKVKGLCSRRKSDTSKSFENVCELSSLMLQYYKVGDKIIREMKRAILKPLELVALEIVVAVMDVVSLHFSDRFEEAVSIWGSALDPQSQVASQLGDRRLTCYARLFQNRLKQLLHLRSERANRGVDRVDEGDPNDADENSPRHVLMILKAIEMIWKQVAQISEHAKRAYAFLLQLCEEQTINEVIIGKQLWQMVLRMHRQSCGDGKLAKTLAQNLRSRFGDLVEIGTEGNNDATEPERKFCSVTARTAPSIAAALLTHLDEWRDDCFFLIDHAKRDALLAKNRKDSAWLFNEDQENAVCQRLQALGEAWQELVKTELPNAQIQAAMKLVQLYFVTCTSIVRYYIVLHHAKLGYITAKCVDLARFVSSNLTPAVYRFIGYAKCRAVDTDGTRAKKANSAVAKQALREMKDVSSLIFAIETFEKYLVELSGKCKDEKLIDRMYIGHGRDFRIDYEKLFKAHAEQRRRGETEGDTSNEGHGDGEGLNATANQRENRKPPLQNRKRATREIGKAILKRKKKEKP